LEAGFTERFKTEPVCLLVTDKHTGKLTINIEYHSRISGSGSVIAGDDLFADRNQEPGFGFGKELVSRWFRVYPMGYSVGSADAGGDAEGAHRSKLQQGTA